MQTASNYVPDAAYGMERALVGMPLATIQIPKPLPITKQDITCYVEQLLTPEEQQICDMATD